MEDDDFLNDADGGAEDVPGDVMLRDEPDASGLEDGNGDDPLSRSAVAIGGALGTATRAVAERAKGLGDAAARTAKPRRAVRRAVRRVVKKARRQVKVVARKVKKAVPARKARKAAPKKAVRKAAPKRAAAGRGTKKTTRSKSAR